MMRKWIVVFLLSVNALLVAWIGWATCSNKTETGHMAATVYQWHTLRFDVFHVNPPLTRAVSGLPVAICRPEHDWDLYSSRPQDRSEWVLGMAFAKANSPEKVRWCFALARWSLIPLLLVGGYFGYRLSREIYGNAAAMFFLILWCLSPSLVSWGATICPDAVAAALGIVAVYTFYDWLHKPSWTCTAIAGVCLGLLLLTKLTWVIAFGIWPLIWCLWTIPIRLTRADRRSPALPPFRQLVVILFIGLYTLNMGYLFDGTFRPLGKYVFSSQLFRGSEVPEHQQTPVAENRFAGTWLDAVPVPLPAEFVQGIDTQRYDFERGLPSYLRGEWADHGWWYYYLYALAVKVPLGTWLLVALAVGVTIFGQGYSAPWRDEMVVLAPGLVILVFVSSQTGFSVHSRYVIPALPFFFIWASKVARVFEMKKGTDPICAQHPPGRSGKWGQSPFSRTVVAAAVVVALIWSVTSSLWAYPHSLSYFNELAGGPRNGGKHLLDSNIDWGQDLLYLKDWLDEHPDVTLDGLAYHGSYPATLAGIPETPYPPTGSESEYHGANHPVDHLGPKPGWYAVSVNYLYGRSRQYRYFLDFEPVASAGYSIYIYHITPDDANRVLGLPE